MTFGLVCLLAGLGLGLVAGELVGSRRRARLEAQLVDLQADLVLVRLKMDRAQAIIERTIHARIVVEALGIDGEQLEHLAGELARLPAPERQLEGAARVIGHALIELAYRGRLTLAPQQIQRLAAARDGVLDVSRELRGLSIPPKKDQP